MGVYFRPLSTQRIFKTCPLPLFSVRQLIRYDTIARLTTCYTILQVISVFLLSALRHARIVAWNAGTRGLDFASLLTQLSVTVYLLS